MCKYWKVYDNMKEAVCTFKLYDQLKLNMMKSLIEGFQANKNRHEIVKMSV